MDVRCERCRAQYVFDDEQVTPQGLTVQCTNCGHVFRVKKKELVVTVPVRPEDVTEQPLLADSAALRPPAPAPPPAHAAPVTPRPPPGSPPQGWTIRQALGGTLTFTELTTLQKWIVERRVAPEDEVSQGDGAWVRLGAIPELQPFFQVVDAAERGRRPPAPRPVTRPGGTDFYPPPPFPPPSFASQPLAPPAPRPEAPTARRAPAPAPASLTAELDPEELAAVRGSRTGRTRLAVGALLLVTAGAAAYVFSPAWLGRDHAPAQAAPLAAPPPPPAPAAQPAPEPVSVAVPLNIELKAPPEAAAPKPAEPPAPAPEAAPAPKPPEPAAAAPPKPAGPRALLAQARKAREGGETARALDLFAKVVAAEPDNVDALTGRGLCYFELGQYAPAEASFQRALQLDLDHPDAIMGLAETYRQQGKKSEALALFERYLAVHPDGEEAAVARYAISQLKE